MLSQKEMSKKQLKDIVPRYIENVKGRTRIVSFGFLNIVLYVLFLFISAKVADYGLWQNVVMRVLMLGCTFYFIFGFMKGFQKFRQLDKEREIFGNYFKSAGTSSEEVMDEYLRSAKKVN